MSDRIKPGDVVLIRGRRYHVLRVLMRGALLDVLSGDDRQTIGAANVDAVLDDVEPDRPGGEVGQQIGMDLS